VAKFKVELMRYTRLRDDLAEWSNAFFAKNGTAALLIEQRAHYNIPDTNRPISVYRFPCRALTLCPQLCMGVQPGARFPARSVDALPATLHEHFTQAMYRNWPIWLDTPTHILRVCMCTPVHCQQTGMELV